MQFKNKETGTEVTVISIGIGAHLHQFSAGGSLHVFHKPDESINLEMVFHGEGRYAGPIVIYHDTTGKHWLQPEYEFNERFEQCSISS